jgi:hypothetical protein
MHAHNQQKFHHILTRKPAWVFIQDSRSETQLKPPFALILHILGTSYNMRLNQLVADVHKRYPWSRTMNGWIHHKLSHGLQHRKAFLGV